MNTSTLVQKLWAYCHALRNERMNCGDAAAHQFADRLTRNHFIEKKRP